jgi:hypothetical protein
VKVVSATNDKAWYLHARLLNEKSDFLQIYEVGVRAMDNILDMSDAPPVVQVPIDNFNFENFVSWLYHDNANASAFDDSLYTLLEAWIPGEEVGAARYQDDVIERVVRRLAGGEFVHEGHIHLVYRGTLERPPLRRVIVEAVVGLNAIGRDLERFQVAQLPEEFKNEVLRKTWVGGRVERLDARNYRFHGYE